MSNNRLQCEQENNTSNLGKSTFSIAPHEEQSSIIHRSRCQEIEDSIICSYPTQQRSINQQREAISQQDHEDLLRINKRRDTEILSQGIYSPRSMYKIDLKEEKQVDQREKFKQSKSRISDKIIINVINNSGQFNIEQLPSCSSKRGMDNVSQKEQIEEDGTDKKILIKQISNFQTQQSQNSQIASHSGKGFYQNNNNDGFQSNQDIIFNKQSSDFSLKVKNSHFSLDKQNSNSLMPPKIFDWGSSVQDTFRPNISKEEGQRQFKETLLEQKSKIGTKKDFTKMVSNQRHLQLLNKIKNKFLKFSESHTLIGRSRILNNQIRSVINDKVDYCRIEKKVPLHKRGAHLLSILLELMLKITHLNKLPLFDPENTYKIIFNVIIVTYNCFFLYIISLEVFFNAHLGDLQQILGNIAQVAWITEMIVQMNTCLYHDNTYITDRKTIIQVFFKEYLFFEILPLVFEGQKSSNVTFNILLHIPLLLKIKGMSIILKKLEFYVLQILKDHYFLLLFKLVMMLFLLGHFNASLFNIIAEIETSILKYDKTWVTENLLIEEDHWHFRYLAALYWSFSILMNSSTLPVTVIEAIFTCLCMLISCIIYGYALNLVGQIITDISKQQKDYKRDLNVLNQFMKRKNISMQYFNCFQNFKQFDFQRGLRRQANISLQDFYAHNKKNQEQELEVIKKINKNVIKDIYLQSNFNILQQCPLIKKNFSKFTLQKIQTNLKEEYYAPRQMIIDQQESQGEEYLYFIAQGQVRISLQVTKSYKNTVKKEKKEIYILKTGECFGEYTFFTGMKRAWIAESKDFSTIMRLSKKSFLEILGKSGSEFEKFCEIKDKLLFDRISNEDILKCYICQSPSHLTGECDKSMIKNSSNYFLFHQNYSKEQERKIAVRVQKRRNNSFLSHQICEKAAISIQNNENLIEFLKQIELETYEDNYSDYQEILSEEESNNSKESNFDEDLNDSKNYQFSSIQKINSQQFQCRIPSSPSKSVKLGESYSQQSSKSPKLQNQNQDYFSLEKDEIQDSNIPKIKINEGQSIFKLQLAVEKEKSPKKLVGLNSPYLNKRYSNQISPNDINIMEDDNHLQRLQDNLLQFVPSESRDAILNSFEQIKNLQNMVKIIKKKVQKQTFFTNRTAQKSGSSLLKDISSQSNQTSFEQDAVIDEVQILNWQFDIQKNYLNYFPEQNMVKVIRKLNILLTKKKKITKRAESKPPLNKLSQVSNKISFGDDNLIWKKKKTLTKKKN